MVLARSGHGPLSHCSDLVRVGPHFSSFSDAAKEGDRKDMEFTVLSFNEDLVLS